MRTESITERLDTAVATLERHGQAHLTDGLESVGTSDLESFVTQVESIDFAEIATLTSVGASAGSIPEDLQPAPVIPRHPEGEDGFRAAGEAMIRRGEIAAFTVAGGQGTRLGWNGPKGTFPSTPITGKPLFRVFAEQLNAIDERYEIETPWYLMTSPLNDAATRAFFKDNNHFGRNPASLLLFPQGVMPAVDDHGRILLEAPGVIAVSPDGHGGSLRALARSGALDHAASRGVRHLSYFQVDNPTVHAIDPLFIGLHATHPASSGEMSSKMVPKIAAGEKVGVFCSVAGRTQVIEYSDLPTEHANATTEDGSLRFIAGSIAIHVLAVDFIGRVTSEKSETSMPFHHARKKVPFWNPENRETVVPTEPNGTKFEMFVFDALEFVKKGLVYETDRVEEFAPIKNADGGDSAESSGRLQTERAARWMESAGLKIARNNDGTVNGRIEITSATALTGTDLVGQLCPDFAPGGDLVF